MDEIRIDCTPSDDGFCDMANVMLNSLVGDCVKKSEKERAFSLLNGILETYRYLYYKGYRFNEDTGYISKVEEE